MKYNWAFIICQKQNWSKSNFTKDLHHEVQFGFYYLPESKLVKFQFYQRTG